MPHRGENLLQRFVRAVADEDTFAFGTPSMSDGGSAVILPVMRTVRRSRGYVLAEEALGALHAEDPGRIDRLRVINDAATRVLIRVGFLFRGQETASRATAADAVLDPGATSDVEARCIHSSQPLVAGLPLEPCLEPAPAVVLHALLRRDQGAVWTAVNGFTAIFRGSASDDLVEALVPPPPVHGESAVPQGHAIPDGAQCGVFVLDADGVVAVEVFDGPDSWTVVGSGALGRYAPPVGSASASPFTSAVDRESAIALAKDFLRRLAQAATSASSGGSHRLLHPPAEYATVEGEVIHLLAIREDVSPGPESGRVSWSAVATSGPDSPLASVPSTMRDAVGDADVAAMAVGAVDMDEDAEPSPPILRERRRKVLTSGWDATTFRALEHYSRKEFGGDRSAALRFLTRTGLARRGYLGPQPARTEGPNVPTAAEQEAAFPDLDLRRSLEETRIHDLERVAETAQYAGWLRKRARLELERLADASPDERLRAVARTALDRLGPSAPPVVSPEPEAPEALPSPPSVNVPALLRRAVMASASGRAADALALFDEVLEAEPVNLTALLGRAVALRRAGKSLEALAGLDLVLRLDPDNAAAHLNRGRILQERGDLRGALEAFDRLAAVAPNDWDVWLERGDVLAKMGRSEDALRSFSEAVRRNPDDEKLQRRVEALERARTAEPLPSRIVLPSGLEEGQSYLVKGATPEPAYALLRSLASQKHPALLISRRAPDSVHKDPGLAAVRAVQLHHGPGTDVCSPAALASLSRLIERFVEEHHGRGTILLDGIDTLVANNSFRDALLFVEHVNELVLQRRVIFLIPLVPGNLGERESAFLERDLKVLS